MKTKILSTFFIILILAATGFSQEPKALVNTVKNFWELASNDDFEGVRKLLARNIENSHELIKMEMQQIGSNKSKIVGAISYQIQNNTAKVRIMAVDKDKNEEAYTIYLIKDKNSGDWKINFLFKNFINLTLEPPVTDPPVFNPASQKNGDDFSF